MQELTTCDTNRTPVKFPGFEPQQAIDKEKAYNILDIAPKKWREDYFSPYALAMMYSCLNEVDKAFEWLDIAYEKHDIIMYPIKTISEFSVLHNDPRWFSLMRRMGLEG